MKTKLTLGLLGAMFILGWNILSLRKVEPAPDRSVQAPTSSTPAPREPAKAGTTNVPGIGPVPTDPKELEQFKAKAKREMQEALRTVGVFSNREDMKQAQDNGELAWIYIKQRKNLQLAMDHIHGAAVEPFPPRMLEALAHILKHAGSPQLRLAAATLLYRYNQPEGKAHLLALLNNPSTEILVARDVVFALAKNREHEAAAGVAAALPRLGSLYDMHLTALGDWAAPPVVDALRRQAAREPRNWGYALGLAHASDSGSVEPLRFALKGRGSSPSGYTIRSALARVGALDQALWNDEIQLAWQNRVSLSDVAILSYLDTAGPALARRPAQEFLKACIPLHEAYVAGMESQAKGIREKIPELANKFPKPPPSEFIMGAAQLLAQWDAKEAVPTLQQVLTTVQQGGRANVYVNEALGLALYKLDPANWRETLLNAGIPPYHVDRIPALAKLRPIPPTYLPKQVNLNAR